jgi:hypothetical protein
MSTVIDFKQMVVKKTFEDLLKDVPVTNDLDGGKYYKLINGAFIRSGKAIPMQVMTKSFMECLHDSYETAGHMLETVRGIKIVEGTPCYEEVIDEDTLETKRKLRILFVIPNKQEENNE